MKSAVITADIVNSTRLKKTYSVKLMKNLEAVMSSWKHEFFRGDSFQVYVPDPTKALDLVLQLRAAAIRISTSANMAIDIRASIAIGTIKKPVRKLLTATDEAFILSGRAFDAMPKEKRMVISCPEKNMISGYGLAVLADFIDYLFQRLTAKQAAVIFELLTGKTQVETARALKKSQATVHKHTQSAAWPEMEKLLKQYSLLVNTIES